MDILEHKKEGFIYSYTECAVLAEYISRYFEDESLCLEYGRNAKHTAIKRHNSQENVNKIIKIYEEIIKGE